MTDPLEPWWQHELVVERFTGTAAYADEFDPPQTVLGFYSDKTEYSGGEVIAAGRFAFPIDVPYIPVQSKVTLPVLFGGRECRVVSTAVGEAGSQPVPRHQEIGVL